MLRGKIAQYEKENKELALRLEELNDFVENASLPLHWVNAEGIIIWANQAEFVHWAIQEKNILDFPSVIFMQIRKLYKISFTG